MKLLPMHKIQKKLEVGNNFMASLKKAGCPFPGNRGTVEWCLEWMKAHPEFKVSDFKGCRQAHQQPKLRRERRRRSNVDIFDEQAHLNGLQNSSPGTLESQREPAELSQ